MISNWNRILTLSNADTQKDRKHHDSGNYLFGITPHAYQLVVTHEFMRTANDKLMNNKFCSICSAMVGKVQQRHCNTNKRGQPREYTEIVRRIK